MNSFKLTISLIKRYYNNVYKEPKERNAYDFHEKFSSLGIC
jgi:hypothetical protein